MELGIKTQFKRVGLFERHCYCTFAFFSLILGETVPDCKWVTSSKVYNWFANRRKDNNRRKRLGQRIGK